MKLTSVVFTVRVWNLCAGSGIDSITRFVRFVIFLLCLACTVNLSFSMSVSYTHLDVYKRQGLKYAIACVLQQNKKEAFHRD